MAPLDWDCVCDMKVCTLPILSEWSLLDILLRVNVEESHGTAPLRWEFQGYRLPSHHTIRIGMGPVDG
jgi:hypothetical protein